MPKTACIKKCFTEGMEQWPCSKISQVWHDCRVVTYTVDLPASGGREVHASIQVLGGATLIQEAGVSTSIDSRT